MKTATPPLCLCLCLCLPVPLSLAFAESASAQSHVLVVSGLPGEDRYAREFSTWTTQLVAALDARHGVPAANITVLTDAAAGAAQATKANIEAALRRIAARGVAGADVAIVLFGHGSEGEGGARLNLRGPDLTAAELATLLEGVRARRIIVVNTASASGGFIAPLAGRNRVIMTATKSAAEQNETLFPRFFVEAFTSDGADADRDGRLSMLEAFGYAKREVERAYAADRRLLTEHAALEADGDGRPDAEVVAVRGDGAAARSVFLGGPTAAGAAPAHASAELRGLYEEKRRLEEELAGLRSRRETMAAAAYQRALDALLVRVARNGQAIRQAEGGT